MTNLFRDTNVNIIFLYIQSNLNFIDFSKYKMSIYFGTEGVGVGCGGVGNACLPHADARDTVGMTTTARPAMDLCVVGCRPAGRPRLVACP